MYNSDTLLVHHPDGYVRAYRACQQVFQVGNLLSLDVRVHSSLYHSEVTVSKEEPVNERDTMGVERQERVYVQRASGMVQEDIRNGERYRTSREVLSTQWGPRRP